MASDCIYPGERMSAFQFDGLLPSSKLKGGHGKGFLVSANSLAAPQGPLRGIC